MSGLKLHLGNCLYYNYISICTNNKKRRGRSLCLEGIGRVLIYKLRFPHIMERLMFVCKTCSIALLSKFDSYGNNSGPHISQP